MTHSLPGFPTAQPRRTWFLASVQSEREALLAAEGGADIVDCKDPSQGALGALPVEIIAAVRACVPRHIPVSATIGDVPCDAELVCDRVRAVAATGVEYVKIGLFPGGDPYRVAAALKQLNLKRTKLVAVMLADRPLDLDLIEALAGAGFAGVMLDTADKNGRSLLDCQSPQALGNFVGRVQAAGCFAGLAGALRITHVPALLRHAPDVLGFRGALCRAQSRSMALDAEAVAEVRDAINGSALADVTSRSKQAPRGPLPLVGRARVGGAPTAAVQDSPPPSLPHVQAKLGSAKMGGGTPLSLPRSQQTKDTDQESVP